MSNPKVPRRSAPSPWAVGLLILATCFALLTLAMLSMDFRPL